MNLLSTHQMQTYCERKKSCDGTFKPRTVRTVEAYAGLQEEVKLFFEPGTLITGVWPASWMEDDKFYRSLWLEGTLDGRVGLVLESCVKYLSDHSDSD